MVITLLRLLIIPIWVYLDFARLPDRPIYGNYFGDPAMDPQVHAEIILALNIGAY